MKTNLILLVLFFSTFSFSQDCKITNTHDDFDDIDHYKTKFGILVKKDLTLYYDFLKIKYTKSDVIILTLRTHSVVRQCRSKDSYVIFMFENGDKLKLPTLNKDIECGLNSLSVNINENIEDLTNRKIKKIRLSIETALDYDVDEKRKMNLGETLKCLIEKTKTNP